MGCINGRLSSELSRPECWRVVVSVSNIRLQRFLINFRKFTVSWTIWYGKDFL